MGRHIRLAGGIALGLLAALALALAIGRWWLTERFLARDIPIGEGTLRLHGARLDFGLRFRSDSLRYRAPGLEAEAHRVRIRIAFPLAVRARVDSLALTLREGDSPPPDSVRKPLDSLPMPDLRLPIRVRLAVESFRLANDSGPLLRARGIRARNPSEQRLQLRIGSLQAAGMAPACSVSANLDGSGPDSLAAELDVVVPPDTVRLRARLSKADLLRGEAELRAGLADSRLYFRDASLPHVLNARLEARLRRDDSLRAGLDLRAAVEGFPHSLPLRLTRQETAIRVDWVGQSGRWSLRSRGKAGESADLRGSAALREKAGSDTALAARISATAQGRVDDLPIQAGGKTLRSSARLEAAWQGRNATARLVTGDSSRLGVQAREAAGRWQGDFSLQLAAGERWLTAFVDTQVVFEALSARGSFDGNSLRARVMARGLKAYGVWADSLASSHVYNPGRYEVEARLQAGEDAWDIGGKVGLGRALDLRFSLNSPERGSAEYVQVGDSLYFRAEGLQAATLPYAAMPKLPVQNPVVDGRFEWHRGRNLGRAEATVRAEYREQRVTANLRGGWDGGRWEISGLRLELMGSSLTAAARWRQGPDFQDLAAVRPPDVEFASLETPGLDLAGLWSLFQPEPPLRSGRLEGDLSFSDSDGFRGALDFRDLAPRSEGAPGASLRVEGRGQALGITGETFSEDNPLLRMALRIEARRVLADTPQVSAEIVLADSLRLRLQADAARDAVAGTFQARGLAPLPDNSGRLDSVDVEARFRLPYRDPAAGTLSTQRFTGVYTYPPAERQRLRLQARLQDGVLRVTDFGLTDPEGRTLRGSAEYDFRASRLRAEAAGGNLSVRWTEQRSVSLRELRLQVALDSAGLRLRGGFSQGQVLYVDPPLRAEGTLRDAAFSFSRPPAAKAGGRAVPALEASAVLEQSLLRYRLRSIAAIQELFGTRSAREGGGGGSPLRLDLRVRTAGADNRVDSDILRLAWSGQFEMRGELPYTLVQGRVNSLEGELGLPEQAYAIRSLEVKWLNAPLDEGEAELEARKQLASTCEAAAEEAPSQDSCAVITRLQGPLKNLRFSYDTDCGGAYGAGASVAGILYSVQRGCFDDSFASGGGGGNYGERALALVEPALSRELSLRISRYTGSWIAETRVQGLWALTGQDTLGGLGHPVSLEITSKEFHRLRLKVRSGYYTASEDLSNPWESRLALEWRPPLARWVESPVWKKRLRDNVNVAASVETLPRERDALEQDPVRRALSLNYNYDFWGGWWSRDRPAPKAAARKTESSE